MIRPNAGLNLSTVGNNYAANSFFEGLPYEEIADILNVSTGTVKIEDFEGKGGVKNITEKKFAEQK